MTELFPVAEEWAARSHCDAAKYRRDVPALRRGPEWILGRAGRRLDWSKTADADQEHLVHRRCEPSGGSRMAS